MRVCELVRRVEGLTRDDVVNWQRQNYFSARVVRKGRKCWREYDDETVKLITVMSQFRRQGFSPRVAHERALLALKAQGEGGPTTLSFNRERALALLVAHLLMQGGGQDSEEASAGMDGAQPDGAGLAMLGRLGADLCMLLGVGSVVVSGREASVLAGSICSVAYTELDLCLSLSQADQWASRRSSDREDAGVGVLADTPEELLAAFFGQPAMQDARLRLAICPRGRLSQDAQAQVFGAGFVCAPLPRGSGFLLFRVSKPTQSTSATTGAQEVGVPVEMPCSDSHGEDVGRHLSSTSKAFLAISAGRRSAGTSSEGDQERKTSAGADPNPWVGLSLAGTHTGSCRLELDGGDALLGDVHECCRRWVSAEHREGRRAKSSMAAAQDSSKGEGATQE